MTVKPTATAASTLDHALRMMEPLACWLIRSGVGYTEFATALKSVFFDEALRETERIHQKTTDSALSLLSGMHRKDISALRAAKEQNEPNAARIHQSISMSAQVLGRWLAQKLPHTIALQGAENSFDALVRSISNDRHPRSVLQELERLGAVQVDGDGVHLLEQAFVPDASTTEAHEIFASNVADHLAAGVSNLTHASSVNYLEQSVFADELTEQSAQALCTLSAEQWREVMQKTLEHAVALNDQDTGQTNATHRFRVGMYVYTANENQGDAV